MSEIILIDTEEKLLEIFGKSQNIPINPEIVFEQQVLRIERVTDTPIPVKII